MTAHAMENSVRTFKNGIHNEFIRSTLYGNPINDLEHAYAVAHIIEHADSHRSLQIRNSFREDNSQPLRQQQRMQSQQQHRNRHYRRPLCQQFNSQPPNSHQQNLSRPEPMDMSAGSKQTTHQGFHTQPWERMREQSGNSQQQQKMQRNHREPHRNKK